MNAILEGLKAWGKGHGDEALRTGYALREIRDRKLYQPDFRSFSAFCKTLQWSRVHCYNFINAANTADRLGLAESGLGESLLRRLGNLPTDVAKAVLKRASERCGLEKLTGASIDHAIHEVQTGQPLPEAPTLTNRLQALVHDAFSEEGLRGLRALAHDALRAALNEKLLDRRHEALCILMGIARLMVLHVQAKHPNEECPKDLEWLVELPVTHPLLLPKGLQW